MGQQNEKGAEEARERLYAGLTPEEREEAERNLMAYVEFVLRVWDPVGVLEPLLLFG